MCTINSRLQILDSGLCRNQIYCMSGRDYLGAEICLEYFELAQSRIALSKKGVEGQ